MPEEIEEQESAGPQLERYIDVIRRRHVQLLLVVLFGWLLIWGSSFFLPTSYKSTTTILVEQPTMPANYVAPNVSVNLQDQLQSITQQILSRTRLLLVMNKLQLYKEMDARLTEDEKIDVMRKHIEIDLVRNQTNNEITGFKLTFRAHDPKVAQAVTTELKDLFIAENLKVRQQQSQSTTEFIESQLVDARNALAAQEAKVREFQSTHVGALPSQQASNLQILSGLQGQLQNEQDSLNTAKQQRVYYQTLIEQSKEIHAATHPGGPSVSDLPAIDQDLTKLRAQLTDLSSRYTDNYPDVVKVKDQIAKTERRRQELVAASRNRKVDPNQADEIPTEQNSAVLQLQGQLQANQAEIANRERAIASLQGRIAEYQSRLNQQPATEQQLAELTRGYEQSKLNYDELLKKKNDSAMATSMEQMQQGERFTVLDPPSLPLKPDFPNRLKFCGFGLAVGLGLGLALIAGLEFLDDRIHEEKVLRTILPVAVISEIPEIRSPLDEQQAKRKTILGWAMAAVVFIAIVAGSTFSYLRG